MTFRFRDPDLGRDRTTLALGRRDHGFFTDAGGMTPADRRPAESPWADRQVSVHDRFDRTLGIPDRDTPMWSVATLSFHDPDASPVARAEAVCDAICAEALPAWQWPSTGVATAILQDVAPEVFDRHPTAQAAVVAAAARRHGVHPKTAWDLATAVGSTVAQTTHRGHAVDGLPALNALASAGVPAATELFLARDRLRLAQELSDPDLPRFWILANGLAHGVPPEIMRRVPARSSGPIAELVPTHDDLVGWAGVRSAVEHLRYVTRAASEGRRWLASGGQAGNLDDRLLALGVVGLTRPAAATQLALCGPGRLAFADMRTAAGPAPGGVLDLSDAALKAVCDRTGWLLGSAAERTQRELVERHGPDAGSDAVKTALAEGAPDALDAFHASAPDDGTLDSRAFRKNPPSRDALAAHGLLGEVGREALRRFAEVEPPHRSTRAEALAHRFPERPGREALCQSDATRIVAAETPARRRPEAVALTFDLGT